VNDAFKLAPHEWAALRALLDQALALPEAERAAWVEAFSEPTHVAYKPRLRSLLAHAGGTGASDLLRTLPKVETDQFAPRPPSAAAEAAGDLVGPYRLLRELGSGGMASVWLAERTDMLHGRQVALKLPHGAWKRAGLAERLAREREILATLEHRNIARLYDAGAAEDGQPYLALEYVQGERIDAWCERKALGVRERLQLFLQVARAVAYAHAQLVVHRDLKPSNILVNDAGDVKLLDFGIAKLLEQGVAQETELTQQAGRALTPDYAAPEQILGKPIGTAADVYALGVVLFELLTGQRPYQLKRDTRAALEEAILHAAVPRPSSVAPEARRKALRGDLDTIVLKALKKEPGGRYGTVAALAEDVERHLQQRPVLAQPDSRAYRLRKFLARNRLAAGAGVAIALALIAGMALALWQAAVARSEQRRADSQAQQAREAERIANANLTLADFLANDLAVQRSTTDLEAQFERAATMVRRQYSSDALVRAHLLAGLAGRYRRIANFERWRVLGSEAEAAATQAGDLTLLADLACKRARDAAQTGDIAAARQTAEQQIAVLEALRPLPTPTLVACLADASAIARLSGDGATAIRAAERIRDIEVAAHIEASSTHADTQLILARAYGMVGRWRDAEATARHGLEILRALGNVDSPSANNLRQVRAVTLREGGQPAEAVRVLQAMLDQHAARGGTPRSATSTRHELGASLLRAGRTTDAAQSLRPVVDDAQALGDTSVVRAASVGLITALAASGDVDAARTAARRTLPLYATLRAERSYPLRLLSFALAELELAAGDTTAAAAHIDDAAQVLAQAHADDPGHRVVQALRARVAWAAGRPDEALVAASRALQMSQRLSIDASSSTLIGEDLLLAAQAKAALGDAAGARADAALAVRHIEAAAGAAHVRLAAAQMLAR
jgi:tRNA A-37 threonylcarbamoyl transferase component Bud32